MRENVTNMDVVLSNSLLKAILLVLLDAHENPDTPTKSELLLQKAGLSIKEICGLLGKKDSAVRMFISRSK